MSDAYSVKDAAGWQAFCKAIEDCDVSFFGIADYYSARGYFAFQRIFSGLYPHSQKCFLPNIEMRLDVSVNKAAEEVNVHVLFEPTTSEKSINLFLSKLNTNITRKGAPLCCLDIEDVEIESAAIRYDLLRPTLEEVFGKSRPYLIFAAANNAGLRGDTRSPRKLNITDEIDKASDGFFGNDNNADYFLNVKRYESSELAFPKPVLSGCDAHSFAELSDRLGKKFTWIKSDLTFEGLRQIIYEPYSRVRIQEKKPISPLKLIDCFVFDFPENVMINRPGTDPQLFCLSGSRGRIDLSGYLTCLVGGRGTGKSTLLNLIQRAFPQSRETSYFSQNSFAKDGEAHNLLADCSIEGSADSIEFLEQNEIEEFATNPVKLTQAIYSRLRTGNPQIIQHETSLANLRESALQQISRHKELIGLNRQLESIKLRLASNKKIAEAIEDLEYKRLTQAISESSGQEQRLKSDRQRVETFRKDIDSFLKTHTSLPVANTSSRYVLNHNQMLDEIVRLRKALLDEANFADLASIETQAAGKRDNFQEALGKHLSTQGISKENLSDIKNATGLINELSLQRDSQLASIVRLKQDIKENEGLLTLRAQEDAIASMSKALEELKVVLDKVNARNPDEIDRIDLGIGINEELLRELVYEDFQREFAEVVREFRVRGPDVSDCLFGMDPVGVISGRLNADDYRAHVAGDKQYNQYLSKVFAEGINYDIYRYLLLNRYLDLPNVLRIDVSYKGKPLEIASFGQRCTAVIVILLLFGNTPIIIDEPEAHLDSSLIANYLVHLIKEVKSNRQIVFATHNANLVVNADCEQVCVLTMPENTTNFALTTIEDLRYREALLALEGGREAFNLRERKYRTIEMT